MRSIAHCLLPLTLLLSLPVLAEDAKPSFKLEGHELVLPSPITFKSGTDTLTEESTPALEHVRAYLDAKSYISALRIEGHSDTPGEDSQTLSEKRALAVALWLVAKGVDCRRLVPVGFGNSKPVADSSTPEGKAQNRRMSFVNAALRDRPIGGMPLDAGGKLAGDACAKK
ncbi:OmpA family protein [Hyalangium sp.]|uniref:OmpA family protein n=1 Tax=Hyalangium sp. TaxID=2028555 RepID=UPI002D60512D|nr:OmpA family protein [Hyalangium sp.]HYH96734.1 OmpA family protein [Hyalangium sp.]